MPTPIKNKKNRLSFYSTLSFAFLLFMSTNTQSQTVKELESLVVTYKLSIQSSSYGNATLGKFTNTLEKTDAGYTVTSVTKTQGLAAIIIGSNEQQSCDFSINDDGSSTPERYAGGTLKKDKYHVNFNWDEKTISFENGESLDMPEGYILDICSMPFALALNQGKGLDQQPLYIVDGKKKRVRGYTLLSSQEIEIETPLGNKETLELVLQRELRPDRTLTLWLSIDDGYTPVKVEEKREHRTTTMMISELEIN